jgi:S-adenosylmethionine synthetase
VDHFAVRFPTCVEDVARVIYDLTREQSCSRSLGLEFKADITSTSGLNKRVPAIVHYSSQKGLTKYEQLLIIASHTGAPTSHVVPDAEDPASKPNPSGVIRPGNTQLSVDELKDLGVDVEETVSGGFDAWWKKWAGKQGSSS